MAALEHNTIYLTLESRGVPGTFHWGIFVSSSAPRGQYFHATNKSGGWQLEVKPASDIMSFSMSLVLIYKLGQTSSQSQTEQVLRGLPADGSPSLRTGEAFTCRIWAKDAVVALSDNNLITLATDIDTLERETFAIATKFEDGVVMGQRGVAIVDSASSSPGF